MPPNTVKVDRSSRWGNPFVMGEITDEDQLGKGTPKKLSGVPVADRARAIEMFGEWIPGVVAREPLYDPTGARIRS